MVVSRLSCAARFLAPFSLPHPLRARLRLLSGVNFGWGALTLAGRPNSNIPDTSCLPNGLPAGCGWPLGAPSAGGWRVICLLGMPLGKEIGDMVDTVAAPSFTKKAVATTSPATEKAPVGRASQQSTRWKPLWNLSLWARDEDFQLPLSPFLRSIALPLFIWIVSFVVRFPHLLLNSDFSSLPSLLP